VALGWLDKWEVIVLDQDELIRYDRQILIPGFGEKSQEKLKSSRVLVAGIGGLGSNSATMLAAAGIGHIDIVDYDMVHLSNLNRQLLYCEDDIGKKKVLIAQKKLAGLNSSITITPHFAKIDHDNVFDLIKDARVVIDGLDNSATRLIVNSACVKKKIPFIYGGVSRFRGMITTIIPGVTPCLACLNPEGASGLGVLGATPAIIANLQVFETIKLIIGHRPSLAGRLLLFNGDDMRFRFYDIERNNKCTICSSVASD
jgi:molybdopterin/thiamine biosynthesis adenylyltransferase